MSLLASGKPIPSRPPLVIVGGSVRWLAASCRRAGWSVLAADSFGDRDLLSIAIRHERLNRAVDRVASLFVDAPRAPWLYTGGIENHLSLLETIAARRRLAGSHAAAVRAVRDPQILAAAAADVGLLVPDNRDDPKHVPSDGSFLVKPLASVGGHGIRSWSGGPPPPWPACWQRRIDGIPHSLTAVVARGTQPLVLGASRQLLARGESSEATFVYGGSISLPTAPPWARHLADLARLLADRYDVRGAIGIDCVVTADGLPVVLEVNPRPTASMELFERATGISIAAAHLAACGLTSPKDLPRVGTTAYAWGKAILFAPQSIEITGDAHDVIDEFDREWTDVDECGPAVADVPSLATTIRRGQPVLTVFARGATPEVVESWLNARSRSIAARLFGAGPLSRRVAVAVPFLPEEPGTASDTRPRDFPDKSF